MIEKPDTFCLAPWVSIHTWPDGKVFPCCLWNSRDPVGNVNTPKIDKKINQKIDKKLTKKLKPKIHKGAGAKRLHPWEFISSIFR